MLMLATAQHSEQDTDLDRGTNSAAHDTERTCALTRDLKQVVELMRFVVGPAGEVVPDIKRKLPGRGIWITSTKAAIAEAVKRNVFARGFKREVKVARDLDEVTERLLERSALDALAMAGKAGRVVAGFSKVEAALGGGDTLALIHASDAADDGKRKLAAALVAALHRSEGTKTREMTLIGAFSGGQLDLALNRPNVVHAALLAGPGADTFLARVTRLEHFRTGISPQAVNTLRRRTAHTDRIGQRPSTGSISKD
ncbi:MAG: RNA-binding protein [Pseudolabrys sp.]